MKKLTIIFGFMFLFQISNGQDTIRRFEFGSTLVTVNSFNTNYNVAPDRPSVEFINGLFFRYTKKRLALRIHASYTENSNTFASPTGVADGASGDNNNKDIRIGIGGQFSIIKRKEWFYTFLDLSYRNVFSTGHYYGGFGGANDRFSSTANGLDCFFGLGFKIKTIKNVYLSPELGYYISNKFVSKTTTDMSWGQTSKSNSIDVHINPVLKLNLTVKF
jgi:hypothetical protein